jgi:dihydroflavonol-4-reductase
MQWLACRRQSEARHADLNDRTALRNAFTGVDAVINCARYYPTVPRPWRDEAPQQLGFYPEISIDEAIARALKWFRGKGLVKPEIKS